MTQLQDLKNKAFQEADVKAAYEALNDEFTNIDLELRARTESKLDQLKSKTKSED